MTGRFAGPFNLFRDSNTRERLVKNYAAKLLASVERIVDRPGGSKFQKLVSQHGDLLFTAMVDKTGPRPIRRVLVTGLAFDAVRQEVVEREVALILFESGLLIQADAYLSAADDAYFAGAGTLFLPENTQHHIQGRYPSRDFNWALVEPVHSVEDTVYTTEGYTSGVPEYYLNGSMYTGLLVAALQGKYGRGQEALGNVSDLFPWGTTDDSYKYYGLMRAPDYTYFAIRTDNTSCKACRMQTTSWAEDLRQRLIADSFSAEAAIKAEAVLMSTLSPVLLEDDSLDEYLLLGETDVTPVEDPLIWGSLEYGWHYSYPELMECAQIRFGFVQYDPVDCPADPIYGGRRYTSYKTVITFSFSRDSEDDPYTISASGGTTQEGDEWWQYPDISTIWRPTADHSRIESFYDRACPLDNTEAAAPLYCWYDKDGYRDVWINLKHSDDDEIHIPPLAERHTCTYMYAVPTLSLRNLGGYRSATYSLDGPSSDDAFSISFVGGGTSAATWEYNIEPTEDSYEEYVSTIDAPRGEINSNIVTTGKNFDGTCPGLMRPQGTNYRHLYDPDPETWKMWHKSFNRKIETGSYIPFFCSALVIPRLNAEGVFIATRKAKTQTSRKDYYDTEPDITGIPYLYCGYAKHVSYNPDTGQYDLINHYHGAFKTGDSSFIGSGKGYIIAGNCSAAGDYPGYRYSNRFVASEISHVTDPVTDRENAADIITSSGDVDLQPEQDDRWDGYFNKDWNDGFDAIHFSAPASYGGNMKYPTRGHTPSEPALLGDYTAETEIIGRIPFDSSPVYWIGWA